MALRAAPSGRTSRPCALSCARRLRRQLRRRCRHRLTRYPLRTRPPAGEGGHSFGLRETADDWTGATAGPGALPDRALPHKHVWVSLSC